MILSQIYLNCDRICLVTAWMLCSFRLSRPPSKLFNGKQNCLQHYLCGKCLEFVFFSSSISCVSKIIIFSSAFEHFLYFENNHFSSALLVTGVDFPRNSISNWFLLSPLSLSTLLRPSVERWISSSSSSSSSSSLSSSVERWISSSSSSSSSLSWCAA